MQQMRSKQTYLTYENMLSKSYQSRGQSDPDLIGSWGGSAALDPECSPTYKCTV